MHKPQGQVSVAKDRIFELFKQADEQFKSHHSLSKRYIVLARKIAMKFNVRFSREQKMMFCKKCDAYLKSGTNCTMRLRDSKIIIRCSECGHIRRFGYKK